MRLVGILVRNMPQTSKKESDRAYIAGRQVLEEYWKQEKVCPKQVKRVEWGIHRRKTGAVRPLEARKIYPKQVKRVRWGIHSKKSACKKTKESTQVPATLRKQLIGGSGYEGNQES